MYINGKSGWSQRSCLSSSCCVCFFLKPYLVKERGCLVPAWGWSARRYLRTFVYLLFPCFFFVGEYLGGRRTARVLCSFRVNGKRGIKLHDVIDAIQTHVCPVVSAVFTPTTWHNIRRGKSVPNSARHNLGNRTNPLIRATPTATGYGYDTERRDACTSWVSPLVVLPRGYGSSSIRFRVQREVKQKARKHVPTYGGQKSVSPSCVARSTRDRNDSGQQHRQAPSHDVPLHL